MLCDTTVVIPTKDRKDMLIRAVGSLERQLMLPRKVIIVDDCSINKVMLDWFSGFSKLDISIIRNNSSKGGGGSRNIGVVASDTKFVSFLDDDDAWNDTYLQEVFMVLNADKSRAAAYSSKEFVLSSSLGKSYRRVTVKEEVSRACLLKGNAVGTTSCVTVSRQCLLGVSGFDEQLPALQDYDCWLRLALNSIVFYPVPDSIVYYTISVSSSQISGNYANHIQASSYLLNKYKAALTKADMVCLESLLAFSVAKAVHRKSYLSSLKYTFDALYLSKKLKLLVLLVPYKLLNTLGVYTS